MNRNKRTFLQVFVIPPCLCRASPFLQACYLLTSSCNKTYAISCGSVGNILLLLPVHLLFAVLSHLLRCSAGSLLPDCLLPASLQLGPYCPLMLPPAMLSGSQGKDNLLLHPEVPPDSDCSGQDKAVE